MKTYLQKIRGWIGGSFWHSTTFYSIGEWQITESQCGEVVSFEIRPVDLFLQENEEETGVTAFCG